VVVVSAMGDTTDELVALAGAITEEPDAREMDMLLATGEHQSATLVSMALHALGRPAISLTGAQAGIRTDSALSCSMALSIVSTELSTSSVVRLAASEIASRKPGTIRCGLGSDAAN
jgi:aspartate kinase